MPAGDTLLKGNLKIGATAASVATVADVVTEFALGAERAEVDRPATLLTGEESKSMGARSFEITITYFTDSVSTTSLSGLLEAGFDSAGGLCYFEGNFFEGATSPTNPVHKGSFYVTGFGLGGEVGSIPTHQRTFPMTGKWTKATV